MLAVDVAPVGAHRLDRDVQREGDLGVRAPRAQVLEDVGLARREQLRPRGGERLLRAAGQDLQPARGEVDRREHVARLGLLRQAGGGAEREQLVGLGHGRPAGEDDDVGVGVRLVQALDLDRALQRAVVDEDHVGRVLGEHGVERLVLDVDRDQLDRVVLVEQRAQTARQEVLEAPQDEADAPAFGHEGCIGSERREGERRLTHPSPSASPEDHPRRGTTGRAGRQNPAQTSRDGQG